MNKLVLNSAQIAVLFAILTLGSKFLGFIREMTLANYYGTSYITDAYSMATSIPGMLLGAIFAAVSTAFMPIYSKTFESEGQVAGNRFASAVINILMILSLFSTILGFLFSDQLAAVFASGFKGETATLTSFYLKVSFCYSFFLSLSGVLDSYLQYKGSFLTPVVSGYFCNAAAISVIVLSAYTSHYYLIFGLLLGYALKSLCEIYFARRNQFKYSFIKSDKHIIKKILTLTFPILIGGFSNQIGTFIDRMLASGLPEGSVASLNYGSLLVGLISGLTTGILATMIYPKLAQSVSTNDYNRLNEILSLGVVITTLVAVPCTLGAMIYANQTVQVVYERGTFDTASTHMVAIAFFYYVIGLWFGAINATITSCFYALHDMKSPVYVGVIAVALDITLNFMLVKPMAHGGLALATSIASMLNAVLLYTLLRKKYPKITIIKSRRKIVKICIASAISVGASFLTYTFAIMPVSHILYSRMLQLGLAVTVAIVVYYMLLKLMRIEELSIIKSLVVKEKAVKI